MKYKQPARGKQSAVAYLLAWRLAWLTIVPAPAVATAANVTDAAVSALPVATAAEQWLGQTQPGYSVSVATSRRQDAEKQSAVVQARAVISRERPSAAPAVAVLPREQVESLIDQYAGQYGVNAATMRAIIKCESGYNQLAKNRRSSAAGFAQFLDGTWRSAMKALGYSPSITQYDGEKNLEALAFVLSTQGTRPWNASKHCWSR